MREAQAAAGLEHDHIVPLYAVANPAEGPPYLVMQYVAGPTLEERIKQETALEPRSAAQIAQQVAEALVAAHAKGLLHRDIKPSNIIIETATGRAKLVDFGLARSVSQPGGSTLEGTAPGTPEYMSPEQLRDPNALDGRSDVYSLGVTLYEALTGQVPFSGLPHMVVQQVLHEEPRRPRRLNDRIPRDLETICVKCLRKEVHHRYAYSGTVTSHKRGSTVV